MAKKPADTAGTLSPHAQTLLALLAKSERPLTAYDLLEQVRGSAIKAPQTVYRALDALMQKGLVHKVETLGAFVACHAHGDESPHSYFAVCRKCGQVKEIHSGPLTQMLQSIARDLAFTLERQVVELTGLCSACAKGVA